MKITFKNSKLQEGTVKISFDGGNEFREYELAEIKDTGVSLSDSQEQWDAIEKPEDWNSACPNVEIVYEYAPAM